MLFHVFKARKVEQGNYTLNGGSCTYGSLLFSLFGWIRHLLCLEPQDKLEASYYDTEVLSCSSIELSVSTIR